jgi:hypothetical protein
VVSDDDVTLGSRSADDEVMGRQGCSISCDEADSLMTGDSNHGNNANDNRATSQSMWSESTDDESCSSSDDELLEVSSSDNDLAYKYSSDDITDSDRD